MKKMIFVWALLLPFAEMVCYNIKNGDDAVFFAPYIVRCSDSSSVQVKIDIALAADISATHNAPLWQTNWDSPLLSDPSVQNMQ